MLDSLCRRGHLGQQHALQASMRQANCEGKCLRFPGIRIVKDTVPHKTQGNSDDFYVDWLSVCCCNDDRLVGCAAQESDYVRDNTIARPSKPPLLFADPMCRAWRPANFQESKLICSIFSYLEWQLPCAKWTAALSQNVIPKLRRC